MVMNKNTYLGLVLAASLSITSMPLLAEGAPAADSTTPETKIIEPLEPSELQRQQEEHKKEHIVEPLVPSELQRQQEEHNKGTAK
jgi:hypothetical protein